MGICDILVHTVYINTRFLDHSKVVTGASDHWTYSSSCSSAISERSECHKHSHSSILSVVELVRFLVNLLILKNQGEMTTSWLIVPH